MPDLPLFSSRQTKARLFVRLALLGLLLLAALPLHAHHLPPGMEDLDEFEDGAAFLAGVRHPLLGLDHWLFAVSAGALAFAVFQGAAAVRTLMLLLVGVAAGGMLGANEVSVPGVQFGFAAALVSPLLLWSLASRFKLSVALTFFGMALPALWQGNAHGLAWPMEAGVGFYLAGMAAMTAALALSGGVAVWAARSAVTARRSSVSISL